MARQQKCGKIHAPKVSEANIFPDLWSQEEITNWRIEQSKIRKNKIRFETIIYHHYFSIYYSIMQ
jgi:hypothetical protein